ncbi:MAG TPA: hypothetical protein VJS15_03130 [Allosphingosinicella sp.]|nr:hypothetical protein [Allosphingosinicella sp.]
MNRLALPVLALLGLLAAAGPALAAGPEQLEQLEPDGGQWQLEYYGLVADGDDDEHSAQVLYGLTDRLALGLEVESEGFAPTALYRFTDPEEDPLGIGVEAQAEFDGDFELSALEGRLILERVREDWWLQGNVMLRHEREAGDWESEVAYGWAASRGLGGGLWLGVEGSGQAGSGGGHYVGPAITIEREPARGPEVEIGLAYQRRIGGEGPGDSVRMFVQLTL